MNTTRPFSLSVPHACAVFLTLVLLTAACHHHVDWSKQSLSQTATGATDQKTAFKIKLPDGLEAKRDCWEAGAPEDGPSVCVRDTLLPELDLRAAEQEAQRDVAADDSTVLDRVQQDGRITITGTTHDMAWLATYVPSSDQRDVACTVTEFTRGDQLKNPKPLLAWMKSICASLVLESNYHRRPLPPQLVELLSQLDGQHAHVAAAIATLKDPAMQANEDLGVYDLADPQIAYESDREIGRCFHIEAKAGATEREFDVCFNPSGRIAVIAVEPLKPGR